LSEREAPSDVPLVGCALARPAGTHCGRGDILSLCLNKPCIQRDVRRFEDNGFVLSVRHFEDRGLRFRPYQAELSMRAAQFVTIISCSSELLRPPRRRYQTTTILSHAPLWRSGSGRGAVFWSTGSDHNAVLDLQGGRGSSLGPCSLCSS
jgi:hypothetical protein